MGPRWRSVSQGHILPAPQWDSRGLNTPPAPYEAAPVPAGDPGQGSTGPAPLGSITAVPLHEASHGSRGRCPELRPAPCGHLLQDGASGCSRARDPPRGTHPGQDEPPLPRQDPARLSTAPAPRHAALLVGQSGTEQPALPRGLSSPEGDSSQQGSPQTPPPTPAPGAGRDHQHPFCPGASPARPLRVAALGRGGRRGRSRGGPIPSGAGAGAAGDTGGDTRGQAGTAGGWAGGCKGKRRRMQGQARGERGGARKGGRPLPT